MKEFRFISMPLLNFCPLRAGIWMGMIVLPLLLGCVPSESNGQSTNRFEVFSFNSSRILDELSKEQVVVSDLFILEQGNHEISPTYGRSSVYWPQKNFLQVADSLLTISSTSEENDWELFQQSYEFNCDFPELGAVSASFSFFRPEDSGFTETVVIVKAFGNIGSTLQRSTLDANELPISVDPDTHIQAEDAVSIVEENRSKGLIQDAYPDNCYIYVQFLTGGDESLNYYWYVHYTDDLNFSLHYWVNAVSGDLHDEEPRK